MKKLKEKFTLSQAKGFTLIEIVVVMAIIAVLAVLIIGAITIARRSSTEAANRSNARTLQACLEGFYAKNKKYCTTTNACGAKSVSTGITNVSNATDGVTCTASSGTTNKVSNEGGGRVTALTDITYTIEVANYNGDVGTSAVDTFKVE